MDLLKPLAFLYLGTAAIDATVHATLTTPFEATDYWVFKLLFVSIAGYWLLRVSSNPVSASNIAIAAVIFAGLLSVYYRSFELLTGIPFGRRVPDFVFGSKVISWAEHPIQSTLLWATVHLGAFYAPAWYLTHHL
jgi:hypothetical protein